LVGFTVFLWRQTDARTVGTTAFTQESNTSATG
jgi:hypothetical protein